jgi:hypothetical protein
VRLQAPHLQTGSLVPLPQRSTPAHACAQRSTARAVSFYGPSRRWRSPELAAGCWGSSAATVASGPQGATYAPDCRGAITPGPRQRARGSGGRAEGPPHEPRRAGLATPTGDSLMVVRASTRTRKRVTSLPTSLAGHSVRRGAAASRPLPVLGGQATARRVHRHSIAVRLSRAAAPASFGRASEPMIPHRCTPSAARTLTGESSAKSASGPRRRGRRGGGRHRSARQITHR